jgi:tetratricopeptide (TPR) repeat protein
MPSRNLPLIAATLAAGFLAGCASTAPHVRSNAAATRPSEEAPALGTEPIAGGVYESPGTRGPLTGPQLLQAGMSREQVKAFIDGRVAIPTSPGGTQPATRPGADEPPPLAVKYYLQGREHFLQGANSQAMDALEKALQLDPDAFTVLRLMGRVCFAASQLARGSMYLERAQHLRPSDVEVNYLLGRYWLERKDFDRAVYYLMQADESPEQKGSSTQTPLTAFYLGRALQSDHFHHAAARVFERFIALAGLPVAAYRYDRELSYLIDEQWAAHLAAAENFSLAGEYVEAIPHYQKAAADQPRDAFIGSRLVNALVHAGRYESARNAALALLTATHGNDDSIQLLAWAYRAGGHERDLIPDLSARLQNAGEADEDDATLTLASAQDYLGQPAQAFATLRGYLERHPTNLDVLDRLFKRVETAEAFDQALACAAAAISANRALTDDVVRRFVPLTLSTSAKGYAKQPGGGAISGPSTFARSYLRALTLQAQHASFERIDGEFSAAMAAAPDFLPARDAFVSWLITEEKFPQVTQVVQEAVRANPNSPRAWQLLIESEAAQQRFNGALKLAQEAKARFPASADLRMQLAAVYRLRGQDTPADAELQGLIDEMPKYEPAYRALINALFVESRSGPVDGGATDVEAISGAEGKAGAEGKTGGAGAAGAGEKVALPAPPTSDAYMTKIVTTLGKLSREIPTSRFAQVHTAIFFARSGRLEESETLLTRLLADDPGDADVLIPLAQIRQNLRRPAEAVTTIQNALQSHAQPDLVRTLIGLYNQQDKPLLSLALARKMMDDHPETDAYAIIYAGELVREDKRDEAVTALQAAGKRFPASQAVARLLSQLLDQTGKQGEAAAGFASFIAANGETTERLYALSHLYSSAGNDDAAVASLQRILAIMPDHSGANNDLGYFWADAGIHLDQAERMIHKAVENEPFNSAFTDSMGWLLYKQGRFPEAVAALQRATALRDGDQPEVIQHLGDALYRAGRAPEAIDRWSQARDRLAAAGTLDRQEQKIRDYLDSAISEAKAGRQPHLSPLGAPVSADAVPARLPAARSAGPESIAPQGGPSPAQ